MVTEHGLGKRVPIKAFPKGVLGRIGVIGCKVSTFTYFALNDSISLNWSVKITYFNIIESFRFLRHTIIAAGGFAYLKVNVPIWLDVGL